mmetsp:Transcript_142649/g.251816  ORF Transcript_142649/g.251816 Transcript_142649/m.251816 type:complete len:276 (+) Transcript_142649:796-1623(+)
MERQRVALRDKTVSQGAHGHHRLRRHGLPVAVGLSKCSHFTSRRRLCLPMQQDLAIKSRCLLQDLFDQSIFYRFNDCRVNACRFLVSKWTPPILDAVWLFVDEDYGLLSHVEPHDLVHTICFQHTLHDIRMARNSSLSHTKYLASIDLSKVCNISQLLREFRILCTRELVTLENGLVPQKTTASRPAHGRFISFCCYFLSLVLRLCCQLLAGVLWSCSLCLAGFLYIYNLCCCSTCRRDLLYKSGCASVFDRRTLYNSNVGLLRLPNNDFLIVLR